MKTKEQITEAIERLKENKSKTKRKSNFGDDNHRALDVMIKVLSDNLDQYDIDDTYSADADYEAATSILNWKERDGEVLEDYLYPEL